MQLDLDQLDSPIGTVAVVACEGALVALDFADCDDRMRSLLDARFGAVRYRRLRDPAGLRERLRDYFDGSLQALDGVDADPGGTPFQRRVWSALRGIPVGKTQTYGEIATQIGKPTAARAVGAANGRNPIALVIPCHRVIGASGALTGYAGGVERKRWLLHHEAAGPRQRK